MTVQSKTTLALATCLGDPGAAKELSNALALGGLASQRPPGEVGQSYYSTDTSVWEVYNGTDWVVQFSA